MEESTVNETLVKRIDWIDNLKAIGIILVVLGHSGISGKVAQYIYSFHMPLFFFLSGYLFSIKKEYTFVKFIKKKINSLIIPYFIFAFISYGLWLTHVFITHKQVNLLKPFLGIFYSDASRGRMIFNIPLWFLTSLFVVEVAFFLITKIFKKNYQIPLILILSAILGYLDSRFLVFRLPWGIDVAFTAIVFFGLGFIIKTKEYLNSKYFSSYILCLAFLALNIIFSFLNGNVDMNGEQFNNIFYFYISALSGTFAYIIISKRIKANNVIKFIGQSSLNIMAIHSLIFMVLYDFRYGLFKKVLRQQMPESTIFIPILDTVIAMMLILIFTRLVNEFKVNTIERGTNISS